MYQHAERLLLTTVVKMVENKDTCYCIELLPALRWQHSKYAMYLRIWRCTHDWTQVYFLRWLYSSKMKLHTTSHVTKQALCCMCTLYTIMWGFWGFWVTTYACNGWIAFWRPVNTLCALISKLFLFLLAYWTYYSHNPPGQYYSSSDRSSEPQQQLHICSSLPEICIARADMTRNQ